MRHMNKISKITQNVPKILQQQLRHLNEAQEQIRKENFSAKYCLNLVEKNDYENFLCTLLLDFKQQRDAFAIRAFNVEIANSHTNVSDETIGKMRIKFWYDSIDKCYSTEGSYITDHPVLKELKNTIDRNKLTKIYLKRLVTSRDRPTNQQFVTIKEMEQYAEQTCSSLLYLLLEINNIKDVKIDHAMSHLGKAQGLTTLLRAIPYNKRNHAVNIPQEILLKHGVSQERILRAPSNDKGVEDCIFDVATAAYQHLNKSRELSIDVPKRIRNLFLPAVAIDRYLERLRKSNFRLIDQNCLQRDSMLPLFLYWSKLRRKF